MEKLNQYALLGAKQQYLVVSASMALASMSSMSCGSTFFLFVTDLR